MRRLKDTLTVEMFQKMPVEQQVYLLNNRLNLYYQRDNNQRELRFIEKYLLKDPAFIHECRLTRDELGISDLLDSHDYDEDPGCVKDWLIQQASGKSLEYGDEEYTIYDQRITDAVARLLEVFSLPNGWFDYIRAYLALDALPEHTDVERDPLIYVDSIEANGIMVHMERGLKPQDYAIARKALRPFFQQQSIYMPDADTIKDRIYLDRQRGIGVSEIARKYYPSEYKIDPVATRDKVKKTLARYKE